jgi:hypothetical protein
MTLRSRLLRRAALEILEELPEWSADERDHLAHPRTEEAARLLAFVPTLDKLPIDPAFTEYLPLIRRFLEEEALRCEVVDSAAQQERVRAWLEAVRAALA